jgi:choline transport protein
MAAWFFWTAGTDLLTAQILLAAVEVLYPGYSSTAWQVVLVAWAQVLVTFLWNVPFFKTWPYALKAMILFTNAGVIFVAVCLLVRTHPKQSAQTVFVDIINESGWASTGVVFFLGLLPGTTAINGFDSAAHMVEEMPDPARQVPQVMVGNALLSGISGLPMVIVFCFCATNVHNLIDPVGGVTIIQIFTDSLQDEALFTIANFVYILSTLVAATACTTTASRVIWSFSEHNGIPFSAWFSHIHKTRFWAVPVNAIITVVALSSAVILLNLGPSFVLGAFFSAANVCFYISYAITLSCFVYKKRKCGLPSHYLDLGGFVGTTLDAISIVWALSASVWLLFPYYLPVTSENMNYSVAIIALVVVIFIFDWQFRAKRQYTMPPQLRTHTASSSSATQAVPDRYL